MTDQKLLTSGDAWLDTSTGPGGELTAELVDLAGGPEVTAEVMDQPPQTAKHATREGWLLAFVELARPDFEELECPLPQEIRVSCGWTGAGKRGKRIGECWSHTATSDGVYQIYISPILVEMVYVPRQGETEPRYGVLDTLLHELIHCAVGCEAKHGPEFKSVAKKFGLAGKMTATYAEPESNLAQVLLQMAEKLGPYPHGELLVGKPGAPKKQPTRLRKVGCPGECGVVARMTKKWIEDENMLPTCVCGARWELL